MKTNRSAPDFLLLILTIALVGFGVVMVYSASFTISYWEYSDKWFITSKQIIYAIIGLVLMFIAMNLSVNFYKKIFLLALLFSLTLLILVFVPNVGMVINDARSWIGVTLAGRTLSIQPVEFAKIGLLLYLAVLLAKKGAKVEDFKNGLLPPLIIILIFFGLIFVQPDFGSAMILLLAAGILLVAAGARWLHIIGLALAGGLSLIGYILVTGKTDRFTSFLDPWADPYNEGYHLIQSLIAFGNGGLFGAGFGKSIQKFFYLPYPHSDFIFAVIGEELGFIGIAVFLLVFILFIWRILIIARRTTDPFGSLFATSIAALFAVQAFINIGGVTGAIPITGVTLPFISAGGSSLITSMVAVGIILSISREK